MAGVRARKSRQKISYRTGKANKKKALKERKTSKYARKNNVEVEKNKFKQLVENIANSTHQDGEIKEKKKIISKQDREIMTSLIKAHGNDYEAMFKDKLNYMQYSVGKLKNLHRLMDTSTRTDCHNQIL